MPKNTKLISGIVAYNPDDRKIYTLIKNLSSQSNHVFIYNNGGLKNTFAEFCNVSILGNGTNAGIGHALNEISYAAIKNKGDYCICFDQDSSVKSTMLAEQLEIMLDLQKKNPNTIAVGPVFIDNRSGGNFFPIFQIGKFWIDKLTPPQDTKDPIKTFLLITSGMMYNLKKWNDVGEYNADYFIDYVDNEWCLRAIDKGFDIYALPSICMRHELSDGPAKRVFGRLALKYGPIRRYYQARNCILLAKKEITPKSYKLYLTITLIYRLIINPITDEEWLKTIKMTFKGIIDGISNKTGKIQNA